MIELYAGLATNALCYDHHGFDVAAVAEEVTSKQRHVRATFGDTPIVQDARTIARGHLQSAHGTPRSKIGDNVVLVAGGVPCTPVLELPQLPNSNPTLHTLFE